MNMIHLSGKLAAGNPEPGKPAASALPLTRLSFMLDVKRRRAAILSQSPKK